MIQSGLEQKHHLANYQNRVRELQYVLGNKEAEVAIEHTGVDEYQMRNTHFNRYIEASMEFENLISMNKKIGQVRKEIIQLNEIKLNTI